MKAYNHNILIIVLSAIVVQFIACKQNSDTHKNIVPAAVEHIDGSELRRVILTEKAVERLDLSTALVHEEMVSRSPKQPMKIVPYSAIIYDINGNTWVYTSPEPRVYIRYQVIIQFIEGEKAFLIEGPPIGTEVVKVGAAELYGVEFGVGH